MKNDKLINKLQDLLNKNKYKKVIVIGITCAGKTTFLKEIKNAFDMDELIFPLLTKDEKKNMFAKARGLLKLERQ